MRSVIFDLDGTLADTAADLLAAANHAFEKAGHGRPLTAKDAPVAGFGSRAMLRRGSEILNLGWGESDLDRWQPVLLEAYEADICRETRFFPEAVETIEALKRDGWRVGICTNKPVDLAEKLLRALGTFDLFDALVGAGSLPVRKPDPAPLWHAIELAGGRRGRSVLVGDTITDRKTAENAGVPVILVTLGPEGDLVRGMNPDGVVSAYPDLPALLSQLCPAA